MVRRSGALPAAPGVLCTDESGGRKEMFTARAANCGNPGISVRHHENQGLFLSTDDLVVNHYKRAVEIISVLIRDPSRDSEDLKLNF